MNASLVSGLENPTGIVVSGSDLFVANFGGGSSGEGLIGEYTTSGATVDASLVSGLTDPEGIAISGSDLFVANLLGAGFGTIGDYTTSGETINASLVSGLSDPEVLPYPDRTCLSRAKTQLANIPPPVQR